MDEDPAGQDGPEELDAQIKALEADVEYMRAEEDRLQCIWGRSEYCDKLEKKAKDLAELRSRQKSNLIKELEA